jgi:hypothetical protein
MNLPRRSFLKSSLAASAVASVTLGSRGIAAEAKAGRDYYELRCYRVKADSRLKTDADAALLDGYLEAALLPALSKRGVDHVGVFSELEVDKKAVTAVPKMGSPVWVLIRFDSLDSFVNVAAELNRDPMVQQAGAAYLDVPKSRPAFERIDSWLLRAFASMPRMELPEFSKNRVPTRVFEMRDYESHGELKALNKMDMFDAGETPLMRDLGMNPMFFGQALTGPNLPHLRYITCGPDLATHLANWSRFGPSEGWQKLKNDPRFSDNTSLNTARFLAPKAYSGI